MEVLVQMGGFPSRVVLGPWENRCPRRGWSA